MSNNIWEIILTSGLVSAVVSAVINDSFKKRYELWLLKKDACFEALNIADANLSNLSYKNKDGRPISGSDRIIKDKVETISARKCYNKLVAVCNNPEVAIIFKKICLGEGVQKNIEPTWIVDLRNEVRKELALNRFLFIFSKKHKLFDQDKEAAFIGRIAGDIDN